MVSNSAPTTNMGTAAESTVTISPARSSRNIRLARAMLSKPVAMENSTAGVRSSAIDGSAPNARPIRTVAAMIHAMPGPLE